jgi:hypothetical protein
MLIRPGGNFQVLQQTIANINDWGLTREVAHYHEIDNNITSLMTHLEEYQWDINTT